MYYKYKIKRKNKNTSKYIIIILIIVLTGFFSYRYREHLMFWKYSDHKLLVMLQASESQSDANIRLTELKKLIPIFDNFIKDNALNYEAYFFSARLHYEIGRTSLPGTFSELIINDRVKSIPAAAKTEFEKVVKYMYKGLAFLGKKQVERDYLMILAYSGFYSGYLTFDELNDIIAPIDKTSLGSDIEDARFYAFINILNGNEDTGFAVLSEKGMVDTGIDGVLFLAVVENMVGRSTNAIMNYKKVLDKTGDKRILRLVHVDLGKIYFNQGLFKESLEELNEALKVDENDSSIKIWIGQNYMALGLSDRARKIWADAFAADKNNTELKRLLGII